MRAICRIVVAAAFLGTSPSWLAAQTAGPPPSPEARQAALRRLKSAAAVRVVNPRAIRPLPADTTPANPAAPAPAPAPAPPDVAPAAQPPAPDVAAPGDTGTPPAANPGTASPPTAPAPDAAATAAPKVVDTVKRGEVLYVPTKEADEHQLRELLAAQVAVPKNAPPDPIHSFDGAVRQMATDNQEIQLKPYVLVGQPLQYDAERGRFEGTLRIGVADLEGAQGTRTLTVPLEFDVMETKRVTPSSVLVKETSPPYSELSITSDILGPLVLHVASTFSRQGVEVTIPIEPTLLVDIDGGDLRAYGLQTADVTIRALGGTPPASVSLVAPGAFLVTGSQAQFDSTGVARAKLRTDRSGDVFVTARANGFTPGVQKVTVVRPWGTFLAMCLGGLIGGFVRLGSKIKSGMKMLPFLAGLLVAVSVGAIVFTAYSVGVKLLPFAFSVEVGDIFTFAIAALGGAAGSGVVVPKA